MTHGRGATKLEFLVVLIVFGILAALLLERLVAVEHETERLEVDLTLRHIDIGLKLAVGERIMRGEEARIAELAVANPLDFLERSPREAADIARAGRWRYDAAKRVLSYRPRQPAAFGGRARLEWRLASQADALGRTVGLRLEPLK
jgi:hypothetical protein